jgi:radical SAM superfamily enzyme YgiQ (UPF0313 family)
MTDTSVRATIRRVLLLNPPSPELVIRDYYCSKTTKSNYIFHPIDLVMQSGRMDEHYEVAVLDAVVDRLTEAECRERILAFRPEAIVFLTGAISWTYDFPFLEGVKRDLGRETLLIGSGDIFQEETERWLEEFPFIDAAIRDFANEDALNLLRGREDALENIAYRRGGSVRNVATKRVKNADYDLPVPRHDLFMNPRYHFSFIRKKPFATVLTDFGCPYPCTFCIMSTLGSKFRSVDSVLAELRHLKKLGVKEIFFIDQTWGVKKTRNLELCRRMVEEGLTFGWTTYCRADIIDEEVIGAWREAGCHTLIFGVEFASAEMLKKYRKGYKPLQIAKGLDLARRMGIRTVGTFIIGLPEETRETLEATIDLACELPLDFASFNVAVPRHGTGLRTQAREEGLADDIRVMDQAGARVAMRTHGLDHEDLLRLKRKAIRRFYLRPSYLLRRLTSVRSWFELRSQVQEGLALLLKNLVPAPLAPRRRGGR